MKFELAGLNLRTVGQIADHAFQSFDLTPNAIADACRVGWRLVQNRDGKLASALARTGPLLLSRNDPS
jgi:hypothetical protein